MQEAIYGIKVDLFRTHTHTHKRTHTHTHTRIHRYTNMHTHTHTHKRTHTHTHARTCTHTLYTQTQTCTHTNTHTLLNIIPKRALMRHYCGQNDSEKHSVKKINVCRGSGLPRVKPLGSGNGVLCIESHFPPVSTHSLSRSLLLLCRRLSMDNINVAQFYR